MKVLSHLLQLLLVVTFLAAGVFAQIEPNPDSLAFSGKQTDAGIFNEPIAETRGNTFVLDGSDSRFSSLLLTVSLDFMNGVDYDNGNEVSGGEWNLAVYKGGQYRGSIFGKVSRGYIRWAVSEDLRLTDGSLIILGGTGAFEGTAACDGYLNAETALSTGATNAVIRGLPF